jgi:hypothetical protein
MKKIKENGEKRITPGTGIFLKKNKEEGEPPNLMRGIKK